jgi:hypothetical protein
VALSDDQKAMLRMLAQREQGYEDMASLMGISVDEVRARVKEALEEIDKEAAAAPLQPVPEPPAGKESPKPARPARAAPRPRPRVTLPTDRRARIGIAAGAAVIAVLILLVAGVFGGGDDDSSSSADSGSDGGSIQASTDPNATQAVLEPLDGGDAGGRALFGRVDRTAVLQVDAEGLEPTSGDQVYTVWLYRSPQVVLRVGAVRVPESGGIAAQFPLPTQLLAYIAGGAFNQIDITLTSNKAYAAEVAAARRERRLPTLTGESVLRGEITGRLIEAGKAASRQGAASPGS